MQLMKIIDIPMINMRYPMGDMISYNFPLINVLYDEALPHIIVDIEASNVINLIARGSSGSILAAIMYQRFVKQFPDKFFKIAYIRKDSENSHADGTFSLREEDFEGSNTLNIFVDDFIFAGDTIVEVIHEIRHKTRVIDAQFDYVIVGRAIDEYTTRRITEERLTKNIIAHRW